MKIGDRIFYLQRSYYGELEETCGMVIREQGNGLDKTITFIDNAANINTIKMIDVSDHEAGHELFFAEISKFHAENFKMYPAGLRLPVIALHYNRNNRSNDPDLILLSPNETIKTHIMPSHLLCCDGESHSVVLQRAMRVLAGSHSGMNGCGAHLGKERDAVWRMAHRSFLKFRDGKLKKMDQRLGVV